MIKPISDSTVTEKVYESLKKEIIANEYQPRTRLLLENLSKELQVSMTPVREALARLNSEGFVESERQGFYVSPITINDVERMFEVRKLIEPYLAREAADKYEEDELIEEKLSEVKRTIRRIEDRADGSDISDALFADYRNINAQIYLMLLRALGKSPWKHVFELLGDHVNRVSIFTENISHQREKNVIEDNNKEHLAILRAIEEADGERAEEATKKHLYMAKERSTEVTLNYERELDRSKIES